MLIGVELEMGTELNRDQLREVVHPMVGLVGDMSIHGLPNPVEMRFGVYDYGAIGSRVGWHPLKIARVIADDIVSKMGGISRSVNHTCGMHVHFSGDGIPRPGVLANRFYNSQVLIYALSGGDGRMRWNGSNSYGSPIQSPNELPGHHKAWGMERYSAGRYEMRAPASTTRKIDLALRIAYGIAVMRRDIPLVQVDQMSDENARILAGLTNGIRLMRIRYVFTTNRAPKTKERIKQRFKEFFRSNEQFEQVVDLLEAERANRG